MEEAVELLGQICHSASLNLSFAEGAFLLLIAVVMWSQRKRKPVLTVVYSVFFILYITLLRRSSGYDENIRLSLSFWQSAGVWAGNLLNLVLYIPFGWTAARWTGRKTTNENKNTTIKQWYIVMFGASLSIFCEMTQYLTGRGWLDVNDVLFNVLGTAVGQLCAKLRILHAGA